jgi:hypothetical protein
MKLGMHLHELWRLRLGLVLSLVFAILVSMTSAYKVGVFPPGLQPKAMEMSAASVLLNLGVGADQLDQMVQRALLLGNVMASTPVRQYIARRADLPAQVIQISSPLTPQYPRPIANDPQNALRTTDLLRSNNEYRIDVKANPTVPILDIYTDASSVNTAKVLANAAVDGLRDYLGVVAESQGTPPSQQVRLEQLGLAQGGSVTGGVNVEVAALVFLLVFVLSSLASLVAARVVRGWRVSRAGTKLAAENSGANGRVPSSADIHRALVR